MALRERAAPAPREACPFHLPRTLDDMLAFAEIVVKSGLALGHRTKESVVIALQLGAELGFTPMQSLRTIAVIQGRPVPSADGCVAAVTASGQCDYFREVETTDTHSTWETLRRGDAQPRRFTFTLDDARRAGLTHREHWQAYPKRMLAARAKKYLAQDTYPDVIGGLLSAEEAMDLTAAPAPIGNGSEPAADTRPPVAITEDQVAVLQALIAEGGLDAEECLAWLRGRLPEVHTLTDLPAAEYARVKKALEDRNAKRRPPQEGIEDAAAD
jgi:hypothetical protein